MDAKCLALCLACGEYPITGKCYGLRSETQFSAKKEGKQKDNFVLKGSWGPEVIWTMKRSHFPGSHRRTAFSKWMMVILLQEPKEAPSKRWWGDGSQAQGL